MPIIFILSPSCFQCWNDRDWYKKLPRIDANHLNTLRRYFKQQPIRTDNADNEPIVVDRSREEEILQKLDTIESARGKRSTNNQNQFESLKALRQEAEQENSGAPILVRILFTQITISLDLHEHEYFQQ